MFLPTSPSKEAYAKVYASSTGAKKLNFGKNMSEDDMDLANAMVDKESEKPEDDSDVEGGDDEAQNQSDVAFNKLKMTEKQYGKYDSITKEEIFAINNYCRDSLWRRAKFINDKQLGEEFNNICATQEIEPENRNHKYVDICLLIQNNMNYRRAYSTKRMRDLIVCTYNTLLQLCYKDENLLFFICLS